MSSHTNTTNTIERKVPRQMSESITVMILLALSGGLQDAYSYFERGQVFANGQTGNVVLMSHHLFSGSWSDVFRYLIPICFYACGIFTAEMIHLHFGQKSADEKRLHWRHFTLALEIILLFAVGLLPGSMNLLANSITSFACALQVQAFRKVNGYVYASTMCVGNIRSGMDSFAHYFHSRDVSSLRQSMHYFLVIVIFAIGAGLGGILSQYLQYHLIWFSCGLLVTAFLLMLSRGK